MVQYRIPDLIAQGEDGNATGLRCGGSSRVETHGANARQHVRSGWREAAYARSMTIGNLALDSPPGVVLHCATWESRPDVHESSTTPRRACRPTPKRSVARAIIGGAICRFCSFVTAAQRAPCARLRSQEQPRFHDLARNLPARRQSANRRWPARRALERALGRAGGERAPVAAARAAQSCRAGESRSRDGRAEGRAENREAAPVRADRCSERCRIRG